MLRRRQGLKGRAACGMRLESTNRHSQQHQQQEQRQKRQGQPDIAGQPPTANAAAAAVPTEGASRQEPALRQGRGKQLSQLQHADVWHPNAEGLLPLHVAAAAGHQRAVAALLAREPRLVDAAGPDGRTALFLAASNGHQGAAQELLQAGADANAAEHSSGLTPIGAASGRPDGEQLVRLLLNAGADAAMADRRGRTPLHLAAQAVSKQQGSVGAVLCLAQLNPQQLAAPAADGTTPLHAICQGLQGSSSSSACSSMQALQKLADCGGGLLSCREVLNVGDRRGQTPLALAAQAGSLAAIQAVQLLTSCGACPNASPCQRCRQGAAEQEVPLWDSQQALQQHASLHTCPLGIAAGRRDYPLMLCLLAAGASAAELASPFLGRAILDGRGDVAAALVRAGMRCSAAEALMAALELGSEQVLVALLDAGLDPNCPGDSQSAMGLLEAALQPGREALLGQLLPPPPPVKPAPAATASAPAAAPCGQQPQQARHGRQFLDVPALAHRLQLNPACYAVRHSSLPALRQLLAAGCPTGAVPPGSGQVPLLAAAGRLDEARCRLLIQAGAAADERSARGESALDVVLSLCTDAQLVQLAAEETQGAAAASERQLLLLVELLAGAGATCTKFRQDHGLSDSIDSCLDTDHELVHSSLQLAMGLPRWSPSTHHRWPLPFRQAASATLLVLRGRGVVAGGPASAGSGAGVFGRQAVRVQLPLELCHLILELAGRPLSSWVAD